MKLSLVIFMLCMTVGLGARFVHEGAFGGAGHDGYLELAQNVSAGNGYVFEQAGAPVLHRPPGYVGLLLPGMGLTWGWQMVYVIFINSLCVLGTFHIVRKLGGPLASLILLTNIWILWCIKNPMGTLLQMFLYTFFVYLVYTKRSCWKLGIAGGALSLTHGTGLIVVMALLLYKILIQKHIRTSLIAMGMVGLIIMPWTVRNYRITGDFIPVVSNAGHLYFAGNAYWSLPSRAIGPTHFWGLKDYNEEKALAKDAFQDALGSPIRFAKKMTLNGLNLYFPIIKEVKASSIAISSYYFVLMALSAYCLKQRRQWRYAFPILLAALPYLPFLTFIGHSQYAFMGMPFFSIIIGKYFNEV